MENLLRFQKLAINFENQAKIQNVDQEMFSMITKNNESWISELETKNKEMLEKLNNSQNELLKLKSENYTLKAEVQKLNTDLEKFASSIYDRSLRSSQYKTAVSSGQEDSSNCSFVSSATGSKMFKYNPKNRKSANKSAVRYNHSKIESIDSSKNL